MMRFDSSSPPGPAVAVSSPATALASFTPLTSPVFCCSCWGGCGGGLLLQPANRTSEAAISAVLTSFFIVAPSLLIRPPHGLADFAGVGIELGRGLTITGYGLQDSLAALAACEDHHGAVGRETRRFVLAALGQDRHRAGGQVLDADAVRTIVERQHRQLLAVR